MHYICESLILRLDDIADEEIYIYEGDPSIDWIDLLHDWRTYELMLDWTGNLDAGGVL